MNQLLQSYQIENSLYNERLAIILGSLTLSLGIGTFITCRSFLSVYRKLGLGDILQNKIFRIFYGGHLYFWWLFWLALVLHVMTAFFHTGFPTPGDPDALIHWEILWFGLGSSVLGFSVFSSCRIIIPMAQLVSQKNPLSAKSFSTFYRYHSYYWIVLVLSVAAHFFFAYSHAGFWPY